MTEILQYLPELISALLGGGIVSIFLLPEKKTGARLDNAERLIAKYEPLMQKLEAENQELRSEVKRLNGIIQEQEGTIADLKTRMHTMELIGKENKALRCEVLNCKKRKPSLDTEALNHIANGDEDNK